MWVNYETKFTVQVTRGNRWVHLCAFFLSNSGWSFCHLMEQCLGDQQFITLLLYLHGICIFALSIDGMLNLADMVFNTMANFNQSITPKEVSFLSIQLFFLGMLCLQLWYWPIQKSGQNKKIGLYQKCQWTAFFHQFGILLQGIYR